MTLALEGIRVLDLSRLLPGPFCTMVLADMGAEVIKIQSPTDPMGMLQDQAKQQAYDFISRNKKSLTLNLKSPEARDIFLKLAAQADVIMETFRPGVTERLGVDYDTVSALNPRIVYCSLTGFGQYGPYRDLPGHDPNYISIGGAAGITGDRQGNPVIIRAARMIVVMIILFLIICFFLLPKVFFLDTLHKLLYILFILFIYIYLSKMNIRFWGMSSFIRTRN